MSDREPKAPKGVTLYDWHRFLAGVHKGVELNHDYVEFVSSGAVARHVHKALMAYDDLAARQEELAHKTEQLERTRKLLAAVRRSLAECYAARHQAATADPFFAAPSEPLLEVMAILRSIVTHGYGGAMIGCEDAELIVGHFDELQFQRPWRLVQPSPSTTQSEAPDGN